MGQLPSMPGLDQIEDTFADAYLGSPTARGAVAGINEGQAGAQNAVKSAISRPLAYGLSPGMMANILTASIPSTSKKKRRKGAK